VNVEQFLQLCAAAAIGAVGTVAAFRARFVIIDKRFESEKEIRAMERRHDKEMLDQTLRMMRRSIRNTREVAERIEKRQQVSLELVASIATKLGVDHRALGTDALVRIVNEEKEAN
jgi:hypothetical protein